jgi:hypothetical protein
MSTNTFKSLSTWRWVIPFLRAKSIPIYMTHISAWIASQEPILWAKLLTQDRFY